eukprot:2718589-Pyramimonas_sp.AAC.1
MWIGQYTLPAGLANHWLATNCWCKAAQPAAELRLWRPVHARSGPSHTLARAQQATIALL